jgi:cytosine/creatinine deaminase
MHEPFWITNARIPGALLTAAAPIAADPEGLVRCDLQIVDGCIHHIEPAQSTARSGVVRDQRGGQVWPGFVDVHTHLDKGHIWPRSENPDGSFAGALMAAGVDRDAYWDREDLAARMDFALRCAYAHGTVALRTHLDATPTHAPITFALFSELQAAWAGRITLQAVSLSLLADLRHEPDAVALADLVATQGGILGACPLGEPDMELLLDRTLRLAAERQLDVDFHVDETGDVGATALATIARAVLRAEFAGKVTVGHCCNLTTQDPATAARTIDLVQRAGLAVVSLPLCNLYLQDRQRQRTPRWRGVTALHELAAAGVAVALGSDNIRDPFYPFGDLDMLEVFREGVRLGHLDTPLAPWPAAVTRTPAAIMGLPDGVIAAGRPADLVLFSGRGYSELLARPQGDRVVLRQGVAIDTALPDHRELDLPLAAALERQPLHNMDPR